MTKKVSVFGLGKSGLSAIKAAQKLKYDVFAVNQGKPETWASYEEVKELLAKKYLIEQEKASEVFASSDLIIISPGIPNTHEVLKEAVAKKVPIISEIEFGLQFFTCPLIAITGTNGKTTTTTMIGEMLKNNDLDIFVCGNIGVPVCDIASKRKKPQVVVMEVSSFQLENIKTFKPDVAIILNITPSHGERYKNVRDYSLAKFNIAKNMTEADRLIYHSDNRAIADWAEGLHVTLHPYYYNETKKNLSEKYNLKNFKLLGDHNLQNLHCASTAVKLLGNKMGIDMKPGIQKTIDEFTGVPHRIEFVGEFEQAKIYNDAKSTNYQSTQTAMKAFTGQPVYLILGGKMRGNGDSQKNNMHEYKRLVKKVLLVGETTDMLAQEFTGNVECEKCYTFEAALKYFKENIKSGALLLSPGYPSFDQFKNYEDRGNTFKKLTKKILTT